MAPGERGDAGTEFPGLKPTPAQGDPAGLEGVRATVAGERARFHAATGGEVATRVTGMCAWMSDEVLRREVSRSGDPLDAPMKARMITQEEQYATGFPTGGLSAKVRAHRTFAGVYPTEAGLYGDWALGGGPAEGRPAGEPLPGVAAREQRGMDAWATYEGPAATASPFAVGAGEE